MSAINVAGGGYRFARGVFQYSAGVAANPGYRIVRAQLPAPLPLAEGMRLIEEHISSADRPMTSFCACELRSPAPFSEDGFREFNRAYIEPLKRWGLYREDINPVARTNVCPVDGAPDEPCLNAFSYTVQDPDAATSFVIAGGGEAPEGKSNYRDHIVALGDTSPSAMERKIAFVVTEMQRRMSVLGVSLKEVTAVQVYTAHDIFPALQKRLFPLEALRVGLTWHYSRPPIVDLEFEMDCRGIPTEGHPS